MKSGLKWESSLCWAQPEQSSRMDRRQGLRQLPDVEKVKNETLDLIKAGHLKADTLIIWGFNDRTAPYSLGIELLKIISPVVDRTQLHIFNQAGHFVFREHPLEVNRLIVEFIKSSSSN